MKLGHWIIATKGWTWNFLLMICLLLYALVKLVKLHSSYCKWSPNQLSPLPFSIFSMLLDEQHWIIWCSFTSCKALVGCSLRFLLCFIHFYCSIFWKTWNRAFSFTFDRGKFAKQFRKVIHFRRYCSSSTSMSFTECCWGIILVLFKKVKLKLPAYDNATSNMFSGVCASWSKNIRCLSWVNA